MEKYRERYSVTRDVRVYCISEGIDCPAKTVNPSNGIRSKAERRGDDISFQKGVFEHMKKWIALFLSLCLAMTMVFAVAETASAEAGELSAEDVDMLMKLLGEIGEDTKSENVDLTGLIDLLASENEKAEEETKDEKSGVLGGLSGLFDTLMNGEDGEGGLNGFLDTLKNGEDGKGGLSGLFDTLMNGKDGEGGLNGFLDTLKNGKDGEGGLNGLLNSLSESISNLDKSPKETHDNIVAADSVEAFLGTWKLSKITVAGMEINIEEAAAKIGDSDIQVVLTAAGASFSVAGKDVKEDVTVEFADGALNLIDGNETITAYLTAEGEILCCINLVDLYFTPVK